jgi:putative transcriptional regulator
MMTEKRRNSRILKEVHEMASDLHEIGLMDKRRMCEFDALCNLGVEEMPPQKIKQLRKEAHMSQAVFAAVLNTSLSTIQKWEIGDKKPSGPSLKLLSLIDRKGFEAVL